MGVPTSEVGYTIATTRRETTKVHKNMWWHWGGGGIYIFIYLFILYTRVGKGRFTVVRMEKGMQVMIIIIALLTQKNVTVAQCT